MSRRRLTLEIRRLGVHERVEDGFGGEFQKTSFRTPCMVRALLPPTTAPPPSLADCNSGVEVIVPKVARRTLLPGSPKFALFSRLKVSNRNCRLKRSLILVFLMSERSSWLRPAPRRILRPAVPIVPFGGSENTWGFAT